MLPEKAICISQAKKSVFRMFLYHDSKISSKMKNSDNQPAVSYTKYQTSGSPDFFSLTWLKQQGWLCCANIASEKENQGEKNLDFIVDFLKIPDSEILRLQCQLFEQTVLYCFHSWFSKMFIKVLWKLQDNFNYHSY